MLGLRENGFDACPEAIIGQGLANFEIYPPPAGGADVVPVAGDTVILNGGVKNGVTRLLAYNQISVPVPGAVVGKIEIRRIDEGRFGTQAVVSIPKVAGGSGSLTSFHVRIDRKITFQGKKKSVLSFKCVGGEARGHVEAVFADGTVAEAGIARRCTPRQ
jgi:hypothetical protein